MKIVYLVQNKTISANDNRQATGMSVYWRREFNARLQEMNAVAGYAHQFCAAANIPHESGLRLSFVLEELLGSTMKLLGETATGKLLRVGLTTSDGNVDIIWEDNGPSFNPFDTGDIAARRMEEPPSTQICRMYATDIKWCRRGDWNILRLRLNPDAVKG